MFVSIFNRKTLEASLFNLLFCFCCSLSLFKHTHTPFFFICLYFIIFYFSFFCFTLVHCLLLSCVCVCLRVLYSTQSYPIHISHHRMNCNMAFVHIFFNFLPLSIPSHSLLLYHSIQIPVFVRHFGYELYSPGRVLSSKRPANIIIANRSKITTTASPMQSNPSLWKNFYSL